MQKDDVIYRQAAIDEIKEIYEWHDNVTKERIIEHFVRLPSAQPDLSSYSDKLWRNAYERGRLEAEAEIIRCKDCKHRPIEKDGEIMPPKEDDWKCPCLCDDYFYSWRPKDNFFCASGERKNDEC